MSKFDINRLIDSDNKLFHVDFESQAKATANLINYSDGHLFIVSVPSNYFNTFINILDEQRYFIESINHPFKRGYEQVFIKSRI